MESSSHSSITSTTSTDNSRKDHLLSWFKTSVAVAVIRSKPANESSRSYAEKLCSSFLSKQLELHANLEDAKEQLNHLQQQLAVKDCDVDDLKSLEDRNIPVHGILSPPSSSESATAKTVISTSATLTWGDIQRQSICTKKDQRVEEDYSATEDMNTENTRFIQSIFSLQRLAYPIGFEPSQDIVEQDTVASLIVQKNIISNDMLSVSESALRRATVCISQVLHRYTWMQESLPVMKEVCALVEQILKKLSQPSAYGQYPAHRGKQVYCNMVTEFLTKSPPSLCATVLDSLMDAVEAFCQQLSQSQKSSESPDVDAYESGYFLMQCFEQAVTQWGSECHLHPSLLHETQTRLEKSIECLGGGFSLVSQYVWSVSSQIESILQNMV